MRANSWINAKEWGASLFGPNGLKGTAPMSREESVIFLNVLMATDEQITDILSDMKDSFLCQVFTKRLAVYHVKVSDRAKLLLLAIAIKNPGDSTMWVSLLQWFATERLSNPSAEITHLDLAERIVGMGFPTEATLHAAWDAQKGSSEDRVDNWLDQPSVIQALCTRT